MIVWIKCTDYLPPMYEDVLVWMGGQGADVAYITKDYNFYADTGDGEYLVGVAAWARINKPEF